MKLVTLLSIILFSLFAHAAPDSFIYEGYISNSGTPVTDPSANLTVDIKLTNGVCILYSKAITGVNVNNGYFSVRIDSSPDTWNASLSGTGSQKFKKLFQAGSFCAPNDAAVGDKRNLFITYTNGVGSPPPFGPISLESVPFAALASVAEDLAPQANVDMNGKKLTGLGNPTAASDAVTKSWAENSLVLNVATNVTGTIANSHLSTGTAANDLLVLDGSAKIPAVDGSQITNISAANISGVITYAHGGTGQSAAPSNGQLLIGNGSGYALAGITAGAGITVTPGAGSITIATSGGGITSFNGMTSGSQLLATAANGVAPAWASSGSTHTFSLPMASSGSVTAGLLSNSDYNTFNSKPSGSGTTGFNAYFTSSNTIAGEQFTAASRGGTGQGVPAIAQILYGNSAGTGYDLKTLIAGSGITITSGAGILTIANSGGGITSLNGMTSGSQLLSTAFNGVTPVWVSSGSTHTFNLPMASSGSVTAGLLSYPDYISFSNKLSANSTAGYSAYFTGPNIISGEQFAAPTRGGTGQGAPAIAQILYGNTGGTGYDLKTLTAGSGITITSGAGTLTIAAAGAGITSLNGMTSGSQLLATAANGVAPAWASSGSTHTFNLPMASSGSVTAGLLSNPDYISFSNKLSGSGTAYNVPAYISETILGASPLYVSNGNFGIGTTTIPNLLTASKSQAATTTISVENSGGLGGAAFKSITDAGNFQFGMDQNGAGGAAYVWNAASTDLLFATSNSEQMRITSTGNVGIGTNAPVADLEISKNSPNLRVTATASSSTLTLSKFAGPAYVAKLDFLTSGTSNFQLGTYGTTANFGLGVDVTSPQVVIERASGKVGIGTTSPGTILDISGALTERGITSPTNAPAGSGRIYFDSTSNTFKVSQNGGGYADLATGGSVTQIIAGTGLTGGTITTTGTLGVNVGTTVGQIVQVQAGNKLPALDGSSLTNITAANISGLLGVANGGTGTSTGSITGLGAVPLAFTSPANQNINLVTSGTGIINSITGNGTQFSVLNGPASTVNYVTAVGAATAGSPSIGASGSDANINLRFAPKGTGNSLFPSGNIGVGTATPRSNVEIYGGFPTLNIATAGGASDEAMLNFVTNGNGPYGSASNRGWELYAYGGSTATPDEFGITYYSGTTWYDPFHILPNGNIGIGASIGPLSATAKLHQDSGNGVSTYHKFTAGTTTGQTSADGFDIGINSTGAAELRQRENLSMSFYTNNTPIATFSNLGQFGVGTMNPDSTSLLNTYQNSTSNLASPINQAYHQLFFSPTAVTTNTVIGSNSTVTYNSAFNQTGSVVGAYGRASSQGTGTATELVGVKGEANKASATSPITNAYGGKFSVSTGGGGSSVTNAYGVFAETNPGAQADVANAAGVYIGNVNGTVNSYGIYQSQPNNLNYFAGDIKVNKRVINNIFVLSGVGASQNIDLSLGQVFELNAAAGATTTLTLSNAVDGQQITIFACNTTSSWTLTLPAGSKPATMNTGAATKCATQTFYVKTGLLFATGAGQNML